MGVSGDSNGIVITPAAAAATATIYQVTNKYQYQCVYNKLSDLTHSVTCVYTPVMTTPLITTVAWSSDISYYA
jgi:hypothetical protein